MVTARRCSSRSHRTSEDEGQSARSSAARYWRALCSVLARAAAGNCGEDEAARQLARQRILAIRIAVMQSGVRVANTLRPNGGEPGYVVDTTFSEKPAARASS